jgi:hypothetical protein
MGEQLYRKPQHPCPIQDKNLATPEQTLRSAHDPGIFAESLRRQGHQVFRTASSYWYDHSPRVYQAFPYHWLIRPTERELTELLSDNKAICLRYSTPIDAALGRLSYHVVYDKPSYELDGLRKVARRDVRKGLRNCSVEAISFKRLADEGWELQLDTWDRQRRHPEFSHEAWRTRCLAAAELPGFEAWGALVERRLAASLTTFQMEDYCYILSQQSHRNYLKTCANNALSFVVVYTMVNRPSIRSTFYGLHSIDAPMTVDEFKFKMGFAAKLVRQRVVFHPWLSPFVNRLSQTLLDHLRGLCPRSYTLAKAEGMMRFFIEGKRPIAQQRLPEGLCTKIDEIAND